MDFLNCIKLISEVVTTTVAAIVLIVHLLKLCHPMIKKLKIKASIFFKGDMDIDGKKVYFFKALKQERDRNKAIIKAIAPNFEMEEVLVLDKKALLDILAKSEAFKTVKMRK